MPAAKSRPAARTMQKQPGVKRLAAPRLSTEEEEAMLREGEALLTKINRGLDDAIARADRMLARIG